jgi:hypothetical protein
MRKCECPGKLIETRASFGEEPNAERRAGRRGCKLALMGGQLDLLVERRRDKAVVEKRLRKLLKKQRFAPDVKGPAALLWRGKFKRRLSARHGHVCFSRLTVACKTEREPVRLQKHIQWLSSSEHLVVVTDRETEDGHLIPPAKAISQGCFVR